MAASNEKKIRIPLEDSVTTFGSGYEIGPKLRASSNFLRNHVNQFSVPFFPFDIPDLPEETGVITGAKELNGMGAWLATKTDSRYLAGGVDTSDVRQIYDVESGLALPQIGTLMGFGPLPLPFSFAFAPNISQPTTFVVNEGLVRKKIVNIGASPTISLQVQDYTPSFDPNNMPNFHANPNVVYYHLNRIWLSYTSFNNRRSLVYFSDALDPDTIRPDAFLDVPDVITCIFRSSASDVDIGAQSHLFVGCKSSLYVLDGDPTQGNSVFRQMKKNFGIASPKHVIETSEGAVFLATDNRVYLISRSGGDPIPIADQIRNQFLGTDDTVVFGWRIPYIYFFRGQVFWIGDISNLQAGVYWSGPHRNTQVSGFYSDTPFDSSKVYMTTNTPDGRIAWFRSPFTIPASGFLQTGYIAEPDSEVVFRSCFFDFNQQDAFTPPAEHNISLKIYNNRGLFETINMVVPAFKAGPGNLNPDVLVRVRTPAQPRSAEKGDFLYFELSGDKLEHIRNWYVKYRVEPRKD